MLGNLLFSTFSPIGHTVTGWGDAAREPVGTDDHVIWTSR